MENPESRSSQEESHLFEEEEGIKLQQLSLAHRPTEQSKSGMTVWDDDDDDDEEGCDMGSMEYPESSLTREELVKYIFEEGIRLQQLSLARRATKKSKSAITVCSPDLVSFCTEGDDMGLLARMDRQRTAKYFRRHYTYCSTEKKTCIWSSGVHSWLDKSLGIMWVAVHGTDSICVITKDEKPDLTRVSGFLKRASESEVLQYFRGSVVHDVEGLAYSSSGLHQLLDIKKPFGVVSVIPGTNKVNEESGHKQASSVNYDEENAVKFIGEKMKSGSDFSYDETIRTAIAAFQHLFHRKFEAKEIKVCVWKKNWTPYDLFSNVVEEHLSVING